MKAQSLWQNRNYRLVFSASAMSNLGDGVNALALPWLATLLTREPVLIGFVAMARQLPLLVFSLPAGVLTDRLDRRRVLVGADLLRVLVLLGVVSLAASALAGPPAIGLLSALAVILGCAEVLRDNTAQTVLPSVVDKADLESANGMIWSAEQVAGQFIGPPLAGLLIGVGIAVAFGFGAGAMALSAVLVAMLALPARQGNGQQRFGPALIEGLGWLWRNTVLRRLALVLGAFNFAGAIVFTLLVLYAQDILGLSAFGYGVLLSALAAGGVGGSLLGPRIIRRLGARRSLLLSLAGFGASCTVLALTSSPWIAGAALVSEAFTNMIWNITTVSYRQRHIPAELLGRVNAAYRFFGTGPSPIGAFAGGVMVALAAPLGASMALHLPFAIAGAIAFGLLAYAAMRIRLE